jgi:hypothetical protein
LIVTVGAIPVATESAVAMTTTSEQVNPKVEAALRAAAIAWAKAFLTGTLKDVQRLQGPECKAPANSTLPKETVALYFRGLRRVMRHLLGRPLDKIRIRGVEVRNITSTSGEAQVLYDLPKSKVGNDNWVEFRLHHGRWKVANCHAPIGGNSTSSSGSSSGPATTSSDMVPPSP